MEYLYSDYYSVIKLSELSSHESILRNMNCILVTEINQSEKSIWCIVPTVWYLEQAQLCRLQSYVVVRGLRETEE